MSDVVSRGHLNLGAVFASAGRALARRGGRVLLAVLGLYVAPATLLALVMPRANLMVDLSPGARVAVAAGALTYAGLAAFAGVVTSRVFLDALAGRPDGLGAQISASGRPWLTLLPLTLALSAAAVSQPFLPARQFGLHNLVQLAGGVFGLVGGLVWGMAMPVTVAEGRGLGSSVARSSRLLGPGRWLFVLFYLGLLVVTQTLNMLLFAALIGFGGLAGLAGQGVGLAPLLGVLPSAVTLPPWRAFTAAYYLELCRLRDGAAPGEVASIFE